jgi:hypothetical protein
VPGRHRKNLVDEPLSGLKFARYSQLFRADLLSSLDLLAACDEIQLGTRPPGCTTAASSRFHPNLLPKKYALGAQPDFRAAEDGRL